MKSLPSYKPLSALGNFRSALLTLLASLTLASLASATAPFVQLSSLPSGTLNQFFQGSEVVFRAVARDVDADEIVNYEFSVDGTVVQSGTQDYYTYPAFNPGRPEISVVVTDSAGEVSDRTSTQLSVRDEGFLPVDVTIIEPTSDRTVSLNETVNIRGEFDAADEALNGLALVRNGRLIQSAELQEGANNFSFTVLQDEEGIFEYVVLAYYVRNFTTTGASGDRIEVTFTMASVSRPLTVSVSDSSVTISSPLEGFDVQRNRPLPILATATSGDSVIRSVEFFANGTSLGTDTVIPYEVIYTPTANGDLTLRAVATDARGETSESTVTVNVTAPLGVVNITSPEPGLQFSNFQTIDVVAQASAAPGQSISKVTFRANGEIFSEVRRPPYKAEFSSDVPGNYAFTAEVLFSDGTVLLSPGVPTLVSFNPISNTYDFVTQTFLDFFAAQPAVDILNQEVADIDNGEVSRAQFILDLLNTSQGSNGIDTMGAYDTILNRFPTPAEYQQAILDTDSNPGGGTGTGNIPISLGETVTGSIDNSFENDVYEFTVSAGTIPVFASISSSIFMFMSLEDESGSVIATSANGFFTINPFLSATLNGPGTFLLTVEGINVGSYTLTLSGSAGGGDGLTGSLNLEKLINNLFASPEYEFKFGPLPTNLDDQNSNAAEANRRSVVNELYLGKYGKSASLEQQEQGSLRMISLQGATPYTNAFVSEDTFSDGSPLLIKSPSQKPFWQKALLYLGMFNVEPTEADVNEYRNQNASQVIDAMLRDPRYLERFDPVFSFLFDGDANVKGLVESAWMGDVNIAQAPWFYQFDLGPIFTSQKTSTSVWFYSPSLEWFWTSDMTYPWIYINEREGWFYVLGSEDDFVFLYDNTAKKVITVFVGV